MVSHAKFAKIRDGMKRGARVPDAVRHLVIKKWSNNVPQKEIVQQLENVLSLKSVQRIIAQEIKSGSKKGILPDFVEESEIKKQLRKVRKGKRSEDVHQSGSGEEGRDSEIEMFYVESEEPALYWKKSKEGVRLIHVILDLLPQFLSVYGKQTSDSFEHVEMSAEPFWQHATQLFNDKEYRPFAMPMFLTDPHFSGTSNSKKCILDPTSAPKKAWPREFLISKFHELQRVFLKSKQRWNKEGGHPRALGYECCWERKGKNICPDAYYLLRLAQSHDVPGFTELVQALENYPSGDGRKQGSSGALVADRPKKVVAAAAPRSSVARRRKYGAFKSMGECALTVPLSAFS